MKEKIPDTMEGAIAQAVNRAINQIRYSMELRGRTKEQALAEYFAESTFGPMLKEKIKKTVDSL